MDVEIVKTICPKCFKIFNVSEKIDEVKCNFCEYIYVFPKLFPRVKVEADNGKEYMSRM